MRPRYVRRCKTCDRVRLVLVDGWRCLECRVLVFGWEAVDERGRAVRPAEWDVFD